MDIEIGKGNFGNTWAKCFWDNETNITVSENAMSYYYYHSSNNVRIKIMKDTNEGKELATLIKGLQTSGIVNLLNYITLKNITVEMFKDMLQNQYDRGYEKGETDRLMKIQEALGL